MGSALEPARSCRDAQPDFSSRLGFPTRRPFIRSFRFDVRASHADHNSSGRARRYRQRQEERHVAESSSRLRHARLWYSTCEGVCRTRSRRAGPELEQGVLLLLPVRSLTLPTPPVADPSSRGIEQLPPLVFDGQDCPPVARLSVRMPVRVPAPRFCHLDRVPSQRRPVSLRRICLPRMIMLMRDLLAPVSSFRDRLIANYDYGM